jgi:hypothetical protein
MLTADEILKLPPAEAAVALMAILDSSSAEELALMAAAVVGSPISQRHRRMLLRTIALKLVVKVMPDSFIDG